MTPHSLLLLIENPKSRLVLSLAAAFSAFLWHPAQDLTIRLLTAWDAGLLSFLALVWLMMIGADAERTRIRAQGQEVDHRSVFLLVVFACFASLFVIGAVLIKHKDTFSPEVALAIVAIICSWVLVHTMFTLHYAAFYYRKQPDSDECAEGLSFSDDNPPTYLDFVYFTFTLAMTSQTSDTALTASAMRRLSLGHTIISFYFYSVVLAMTVSIVSGLI
jgi:uncharacterized membrane protein